MKSNSATADYYEGKRKLIFVWNYTNWGGAQIYLLAIMKEAAAEWDTLAILPAGSSIDLISFLEQIGVKYELTAAEVDNSAAPTLYRKLKRTARRIRAEIITFKTLMRFDLRTSILHMESAPWQSWILYTALCARGANVFVTMHNPLPDRPRWRVVVWKARLRFLSRLSGFHLFASNQHTRNKLKGWVDESFWQKIKVTYTCVDPVQIKQAAELPLDSKTLRKHFEISTRRLIVLCVAQFIDRKGRWTYLEAARQVAKTSDYIDFVWVTPELPDAADCERVVNYGLGERFKLIKSATIGRTRVEILSFFRLGDVFVLPSYVEGLPISLLEAMAIGLPVISTDVNAIPEAVKDNVTGMLVSPGDPSSLAQAILALASDQDLRDRLAIAGQDFVLENFDERIASRIALNEYQECFEGPTYTK